jgi:hypothetical protein
LHSRPLLQPPFKGIAQRQQCIDLRNDVVLFGERGGWSTSLFPLIHREVLLFLQKLGED